MSATSVSDIMTKSPVTCTATTDLEEVALLMARHDIGAVPVVEARSPQRPRGIVTDRDIVMRTVAEDINPLKMKAADVMTNGALFVAETDPVEACLAMMKEHRVRRVMVVDEAGACCGIVTQADLARHLDSVQLGEALQPILQPSPPVSVPATS